MSADLNLARRVQLEVLDARGEAESLFKSSQVLAGLKLKGSTPGGEAESPCGGFGLMEEDSHAACTGDEDASGTGCRAARGAEVGPCQQATSQTMHAGHMVHGTWYMVHGTGTGYRVQGAEVELPTSSPPHRLFDCTSAASPPLPSPFPHCCHWPPQPPQPPPAQPPAQPPPPPHPPPPDLRVFHPRLPHPPLWPRQRPVPCALCPVPCALCPWQQQPARHTWAAGR